MRPKDIGTTRAESACRDYLKANGWPDCDRQPLRGNLIVCRSPLVIAEAKGGQMAEKASDNLIREWLAQTDDEAVHAGADLGVLIVRRHRRPVAQWDAWMPAGDWAWLLGFERHSSWFGTLDKAPLRGSLADWARMVKAVGGDA